MSFRVRWHPRFGAKVHAWVRENEQTADVLRRQVGAAAENGLWGSAVLQAGRRRQHQRGAGGGGGGTSERCGGHLGKAQSQFHG